MRTQILIVLIALIALSSVRALTDEERKKCFGDLMNNPPCTQTDTVCTAPYQEAQKCWETNQCVKEGDNTDYKAVFECFDKCKGTNDKVVAYTEKIIACTSNVLTFTAMIFGLLIMLF